MLHLPPQSISISVGSLQGESSVQAGQQEELLLIRGMLQHLGLAGEISAAESVSSLCNDLFTMARAWERENPSLALQFYHLVEQSFGDRPNREPFVRRAVQRRELMTGQAPVWQQIPQMLDQVLEAALDPVMIGSFLVAGGVSRVVGVGAARFLANRAPLQWLQRGLGNRAAAGSLAFAAEVPSFVAAGHGLELALYADANLSDTTALRHELASAGLFLGSLKLSGFFTSQLLRGLSAEGGWLTFGRAAGTLAGIHGGHYLEEGLGYRPAPRSEWNRAADTLGTWFQLQAAGRLVAGIAPTRMPVQPVSFATMEQGLRQLLSARDLVRVAATTEPPINLASSPSGENRIGTDPLWESLGRRLPGIWNYSLRGSVHQIGAWAGDVEAWSALLMRSQLADTQATAVSFYRLYHALRFTNTRGEQGSYLAWVTRIALGEIVREGKTQGLRDLMNVVYQGASGRILEKTIATHLPELTIPASGSLVQRGRDFFSPESRDLRERFPLGLKMKSRGVIYRALQRMETLPPNSGLRVESEQWLRVFHDGLEWFPHLRYSTEQALRLAEKSPLGYLRAYRLYRIFAHVPDSRVKLQELVDPLLKLRSFSDRTDYPTDINRISNSQNDGFVRDPQLTEYLRSVHERLPSLLDRDQIMTAVRRRHSILRRLWPEVQPLTPESLIRALEELGDPLSLSVVNALWTQDVALEVLPSTEFNALARRHNGDDKGEHWQAFILYPEDTGGLTTMYLRDIQNVSYGPFLDLVFTRLGNIIHEHEHAIRPIEQPRTVHSILSEEMIAHVRTIDWRAQHGAVDRLDLLTQNGTQSWAMALRDELESSYELNVPAQGE